MGPPPKNLSLPPPGVPESVVSPCLPFFWVPCFDIINQVHLGEELMLESCYFRISHCCALS